MSKPIYLDYMATTPIDPRVIHKMLDFMGPGGIFGNPSSTTHNFGRIAAVAVDTARKQIALTINAQPNEIIFTSGATEANNLAILGIINFYRHKGNHLITMATEHKTILASFQKLEQQGFQVTYLSPEKNGLLDLDKLASAISNNTILASIMHVNNEIGVIQDLEKISYILEKHGVLFHVDAAQSAGKLPIDVKKFPVHLMSFSAHKNYGPKGIGALYICNKPRIRLSPQSFGGGQELGLRSGTLATHQIVGMGEAFALSHQLYPSEQQKIAQQKQILWNGIKDISAIQLNGDAKQRIAGNLNITFNHLHNESILFALHDLAISTTSACAATSKQPSHVLHAIGLTPTQAYSSIRLSLGRFTTDEEITRAIAIINQQIKHLYEIAPI